MQLPLQDISGDESVADVDTKPKTEHSPFTKSLGVSHLWSYAMDDLGVGSHKEGKEKMSDRT